MDALAGPLNAALAPLRPHLQPVTAQLPGAVREALTGLLGSECYSELVVGLVAQPACMSLALSKGLGVGIIGMSSVVKVPQLLKVIGSRSGEGLSSIGLTLETVSFVITAMYNWRSGNPVTTYGESALIALQNVAIGVAMNVFKGDYLSAGSFAFTMVNLVNLFSRSDIVPFDWVQTAMAAASFLGVASKIPQIYQNWQQGSTGQLSAFAVFAFLFGSASRVFTTLQEVDDVIILGGFVAGLALNLVLAAQMVYYWNVSPAPEKAPRETARQAQAVLAGDDKAQAETTGAQKAKSPSTRRRG